jgi:hypothetical protein
VILFQSSVMTQPLMAPLPSQQAQMTMLTEMEQSGYHLTSFYGRLPSTAPRPPARCHLATHACSSEKGTFCVILPGKWYERPAHLLIALKKKSGRTHATGTRRRYSQYWGLPTTIPRKRWYWSCEMLRESTSKTKRYNHQDPGRVQKNSLAMVS